MSKILTLRPDHSEAASQQPVYFQDPNSGDWDWYPRGRLPQKEPTKTPWGLLFGKLKNLLFGLGAFLALWFAFLILVFVVAELLDWIVT